MLHNWINRLFEMKLHDKSICYLCVPVNIHPADLISVNREAFIQILNIHQTQMRYNYFRHILTPSLFTTETYFLLLPLNQLMYFLWKALLALKYFMSNWSIKVVKVILWIENSVLSWGYSLAWLSCLFWYFESFIGI